MGQGSDNSQSIGNALRVGGGGYFGGKVTAEEMYGKSFLTFTGAHIGVLEKPLIINNNICKLINNKYIYNSGLLVYVDDSINIDICDSKI